MSDYAVFDKSPLSINSPAMAPETMGLPWPYNLLARLNATPPTLTAPVNYQVTPEHTDYLTGVINGFLSKQKAACLLGFFRDGMNTEEIGRQVGLDRTMVAITVGAAMREIYQAKTVRCEILYGRVPELL